MPYNPYTLPMLHANCTCGDCEHLVLDPESDIWYCPEAAEFLRQKGWPKASVAIDPDMSAESCPSFAESTGAKMMEAEARSASQHQQAVRGHKGFAG